MYQSPIYVREALLPYLGSCGVRAMNDQERRSMDGRRCGKDRRSGLDTRTPSERKRVGERRATSDRRSGVDRRASEKSPQPEAAHPSKR
jgi:hypothetical protein